jgi:WD40 repeat protein
MKSKKLKPEFCLCCLVVVAGFLSFIPSMLKASVISACFRYSKRMSEANVMEAAVSPDSKTLVTLNGDHTIGLWDLKSGKLIKYLTGHKKRLMRLAISSDGKYLATGSFSGEKIKIWELESGTFLKEFAQFCDLTSLAFSKDGQILAISGIPQDDKKNCVVELWNVEKGTKMATLIKKNAEQFYPGSLRFSPDGKYLATGIQNKMHGIMIWDISSRKLVKTIFHSKDIVAIDYSPDGSLIAGGGTGNKACIWNVPDGKILHAIPGHTSHITGASFHPQGRYFATSSFGTKSRFRVWDSKTGQQAFAMKELRGRTNNVIISKDGMTLVVLLTTYGNLGDPPTLEVYDLNI